MSVCDVLLGPSSTNTLNNIQIFMHDTSYREILENSANYNTRLRIERKLRMPFLDAQTGVAQNHSNLFMNARQRMPGLQDGQIYTYPTKRWRKKRRQYLMHFLQPKRKEIPDFESSDNIATISNDLPVTLSEDSKDSLGGSSSKDESMSKDAWYYEDMEMQEIEGYDEPDPDSDYDYEDSYAKKRKRRSGKSARGSVSETPIKRGLKGFGRGRRRGINYTPDYSVDSDKPYFCDLCGARYKTRPGLTYHYTHTHKDRISQDEEGSAEGAPPSPSTQKGSQSSASMSKEMHPSSMQGPLMSVPINQGPMMQSSHQLDTSCQGSSGPWGKFQDSYLTFLGGTGSSNAFPQPGPSQKKAPRSAYNQPEVIIPPVSNMPSMVISSNMAGPSGPGMPPSNINMEDESSCESDKKDDMTKDSAPSSDIKGEMKGKANPSPYCDFCLGNEDSNKKSGQPEVLVSCSDCGRSGHPSCLQFTANMIISVRKYRWQCIECKCCSFCGTSDNDDQLLFCDDCDRGYHMYCLSPPLVTPPEGSWSCKLCIKEFHSK